MGNLGGDIDLKKHVMANPGGNGDLKNIHVFMVSFPGQGHVNPLLRLGKRLADFGLFITFTAPESTSSSIRATNNITDDTPIPLGRGMIRFEFLDDGWAMDHPKRKDIGAYLVQLELSGREKLPKMIREQSRPVSFVINNPFVPWVSDVAESLGIPSAMLWVQSCASFSAYYHYCNNSGPFPSEEKPEIDVELPFLPLLKGDEIPSFLHPATPYPFIRDAILGQFKRMSKPACILMDTFQELEKDVIDHMSKVCRPIKTIGPLFKTCTDSGGGKAMRVDFHPPESCLDWLDAMPPRTVVYVSFGSIVHLKQEQIVEIAHGLLLSEVRFLWVIKPPLPEFASMGPHVLPDGFLEKAGDKGRIVRWAPQEGVLSHPATACFLTHCGWNSTVEALTNGVPVVAFPQWGDQVTDAKFLVDVFKVGMRLCRGEAEGRIVPRDEVERCLRAATGDGPEAVGMRESAMRWKKAAKEAVAEGGSSYKNMEEFVHDIAHIGKRGNFER